MTRPDARASSSIAAASSELGISSPLAAVRVPARALTEHVLGAAPHGATALVDGMTGAAVTFGELRAMVAAAARSLERHGVERGDVVALLCPNAPVFAVWLFAVWRCGAVVATLDVQLAPDELGERLRGTAADVLLVHERLAAAAAPVAAACGVSLIAIDVTEPVSRPGTPLAGAAGPHDVAALLWSSGTGGRPKAAQLTHRNLVANIQQHRPVLRLGRHDVALGVAPFSHAYGLVIVLLAALHAGAAVVTLPRFDPARILWLIRRYGVTRLYVTPPALAALADAAMREPGGTSSVRHVLCGAAPLSSARAEEAARALGVGVCQGYGMTEAGPGIACVPLGATGPAESVGPLLPGTSGLIVDASSRAVPRGQPGELLVRGPQVMGGYLAGTDDGQAETFRDGWLRTGDLVLADAQGWLTVVDRVKDLIKVNAYQVAPSELEAVLERHPAVSAACVVGVHDDRAGQRARAFVTVRGRVEACELEAWLATRVAPYKHPVALDIVDDLPVSPSGKLLRRLAGSSIVREP